LPGNECKAVSNQFDWQLLKTPQSRENTNAEVIFGCPPQTARADISFFYFHLSEMVHVRILSGLLVDCPLQNGSDFVARKSDEKRHA